MLTNNPNPLYPLNNKRKFIFATTEETEGIAAGNFYIRIITEQEDMQKRRDCSDLLLEMLNSLAYKEAPLEPTWSEGYERRIVDNKRCIIDNYTYFILENEAGLAIGILSGDIYPNNNQEDSLIHQNTIGIQANNLFIKREYRNAGFAQMLLSKIFTVIPKMAGEISMIVSPLSKESLALSNLERYQKYAKKVDLHSGIQDKSNKENGIFFIVKNKDTSPYTYAKAKEISKSLRVQVATSHNLDITKNEERKRWRCTP